MAEGALGCTTRGDEVIEATTETAESADTVTDDVSYIEDVFGPDGLFAQQFEHYKIRDGQIEMVRLVDQALRENRNLVAEASTGLGKSLSYSVPSVYHAVNRGRKVLITTANIALQEQLVKKDLPLLKRILPWPFDFALIKGKSNYLCRVRWQSETIGGKIYECEEGDEASLEEIRAWASHTETGDKSELMLAPSPKLWSRFSSSSEDCDSGSCAYRSSCFAIAAREAAHRANVIVCNHHLLCCHLKIREAAGADIILPSCEVVVCDEAHALPDIARDFFGFSIASGVISHLLTPISHEGGFCKSIKARTRNFFRELGEYASSKTYKARLRKPNEFDCTELLDILRAIQTRCIETLTALEEDGEEPDGRLIFELNRAIDRCSRLLVEVKDAFALADPNCVYFVEQRKVEKREDYVSFHAKPVNVAAELKRLLFDSATTTILTSATLSVAGRNGKPSFDYFIKEVGIPDPLTSLLSTPFNYVKQALIVSPKGLPDPGEEADAYRASVAQLSKETVFLAQGRTLGLFTSKRNLDLAYEALKDNDKFHILKQGLGSNNEILAAFKSDVNSVLLGTKSFWAGIDVPGEALSCVILDRLPFPTMDDPVLDFLREKEKDRSNGVSSWEYSLVRAIIEFKQGFGRLIRSVSDKGVVVVLDGRLKSKGYGAQFLKSLPPMGISRDLRDVYYFLQGKKLVGLEGKVK